MPFIQYFASLRDQVLKLPPWRRAALAIGAGLVVVLVVYQQQAANSADFVLFSGRVFSPQELTNIEAAFAKRDLSLYRIEDGQVRVPSEQRAAYVGALVDGDALPLQFDIDLKDELSKASPFESAEQWRARVQLAKQRELAKVLCAMDAVEDATVQFDQQRGRGLRATDFVTAMVVVKPAASRHLDATQIHSIRKLVAASKANLQPQDVTVTDLQTGIAYSGQLEQARAFDKADEYALRKSTFERRWSEKVISVLSFIPGVEVATNVDLIDDPSAPERAFLPNNVRVSVGIPHSYYEQIERTRAAAEKRRARMVTARILEQIESETKSKVHDLVASVLPASTPNCQSDVFVTTFTDLGVTAGHLEEVSSWTALSQLNPVVCVCLLGIGIIGFMLVRGIWSDVSRAHRQSRSVDAYYENQDTDVEAESMIIKTPLPDRIQDRTEPSMPTAAESRVHPELTRLVREDPRAAAEVLGDWVRKAG